LSRPMSLVVFAYLILGNLVPPKVERLSTSIPTLCYRVPDEHTTH